MIQNYYQTEQENFWAGTFGDTYTLRNDDATLVSSNISLFTKIFAHTRNISSVMEYGANIGLNLMAIKQIKPTVACSAVEINDKAVSVLKNMPDIKVYHDSMVTFSSVETYDLVLVKGVLIHLDPSVLSSVYDLLYQSSKRYICIAEYYSPAPVEVVYRGHTGKLFKRDFAGEMLEKYRDLVLLDYGFVYRRDTNFAQDDINWFLLEKVL